MKVVMILGTVLILASCGADGEPVQPTAHTQVTLNQNGVSLGTNLGLRQGPFSINLGLGL